MINIDIPDGEPTFTAERTGFKTAPQQGGARPKNMMDEDVSSVYEITPPPKKSSRNSFDGTAIEVRNDREAQIVETVHTTATEVEGRGALGTLVNERIGDMGKHAAKLFGEVVEIAATVETATNAGGYRKGLREYHAQLLVQTGRHTLETLEISARNMQESIARPFPPLKSKQKGVFRAVRDFFVGEE